MEPPPTGGTAPPADANAPLFRRETRRTSDGGIPRSAVKDLSHSERAPFPTTIPISVTSTENKSKATLPPHVHGTLRNRERLSDAGMAAPSINLAAVKEGENRLITGVSPKRVMKAPASPNSESVINSLKKDSIMGGGILRTISSRTQEAWEKLDNVEFLEKFTALTPLECINVAAVLGNNKFDLIKDKFKHACKKHLPKLSGDERKLLIDLYTRKGVLSRVELLLKSLQLNSFAEDMVQEEILRNKTLLLVNQTDSTDKLKGYAQHYSSHGFPLEKFLKIIVAEQKDALNPRLLRFGFYLLETAYPEIAIHYGSILFSYLDHNNDDPNKPAILVELREGMRAVLAKKKSTYLAGQLVRELCFKCHDEPSNLSEKLSNTEQLIFDIAYGYFRYTKLNKLLSILAMAYFAVTNDWSKRVLMLKLMIELLRITPPEPLDAITQAYVSDAIESASANINEEIKREGLELKRIYERFLYECSIGILNNRAPKLIRMPSKSNIQAEKVAKSPSPFLQETKWEQVLAAIIANHNTASFLIKIAHDLKHEMLTLLRQITVPELVGLKWQIESIPSMAANAKFSDKLSFFVMGSILSQESVTCRARMIEFYIELLSVVSQINDYASGYVISIALNDDIILRLTKTWKKVSPTAIEKLDKIKTLYSLTQPNIKITIREIGEESYTLPSIILSRDVLMNNEKFPTMNGTNLNFDGLKHLADIVYQFLKCIKNVPDSKRGTDFILLINNSKFTDQELKELSHKRESGKNLKEKIGSAITRKP